MFNEQSVLILMEVLYDFWLATLVLSFSASIVLIHNYLNSRKTLIGRVALYTALSSLFWSISVSVYTFPFIEQVQYSLSFLFLAFGFLAGTITMLAAYERAKIQSILTPREKERHESRFLTALSILVIAIALAGILSQTLNNPFLNSVMGNTSILTAFGLILISVCLIGQNRPKFSKKLINLLAGTVFIIGAVILFGYFAISYITSLDAFLPLGATTLETAKGFIFASAGIALAMKRGLKAWLTKIILAMGILFIVILDLVAELIFHPAFLPNSAALCFIFVGIVQLWRALKTR